MVRIVTVVAPTMASILVWRTKRGHSAYVRYALCPPFCPPRLHLLRVSSDDSTAGCPRAVREEPSHLEIPICARPRDAVSTGSGEAEAGRVQPAGRAARGLEQAG